LVFALYVRSWRSPLRLHRRQTALLRDNRVELLIDGGPFFSAVVDAIESAKEYVLMETYIVADDKTGRRIQEALIERAAAGVEVAFVYDAFGSLGLDQKYINILHEAGVKTHKFRPFTFMRIKRWAKRNHRKMLVVDGRIAVVGGMNISDDYAALEDGGQAWRDTAVCVQGPAVAQLEELFRKMWTLNSRQILRSLACKPPSFSGGHQVRFLANYGRADRADIHGAYLHAIKDAQKTIRIMTAYFTPDRRLLAALGRAAKRGVAVEIITAGATDLEVILHASRGLYANLLRHGVRIYEWHERVLHAKTAVIDGQWSTVGSANLNHRTWLLDQEVNATIFGEKFAKQMDQQFASDRARCKVISRQTWKARPRWRRLVEWFFGLFRRLI
jgi:cardiolipin synthase